MLKTLPITSHFLALCTKNYIKLEKLLLKFKKSKYKFEILSSDDKNLDIVSVGSSVNWSDFVTEMVDKNIYGYENLSSIPGSVGASPIQNIGAYGQEVSRLINSIDCYV